MLKEMGEEAIINTLLKTLVDDLPDNPLNKDDDAIAYRSGSNWLILKLDGSNALSSKYPWMSWESLGYRIALGAITDVIAKGGKPIITLASVGIPADHEVHDLTKLLEGVGKLSARVGAMYVGGDVNKSLMDVWLDVFALGIAKNPIPDNPLKIGDKLYVSRCMGLSSIPYIALLKGLDMSPWTDILRKVAEPEPAMDFLDISRTVKASTDISDGLRSVLRILRKNSVGLLVNEFPLCYEVEEFMREERIDILDVIRYLGEEYSILFASSDEQKYNVLGTIVQGEGITFRKAKIMAGGWDNFKGFIT